MSLIDTSSDSETCSSDSKEKCRRSEIVALGSCCEDCRNTGSCLDKGNIGEIPVVISGSDSDRGYSRE